MSGNYGKTLKYAAIGTLFGPLGTAMGALLGARQDGLVGDKDVVEALRALNKLGAQTGGYRGSGDGERHRPNSPHTSTRSLFRTRM